MLSKLRNYYIAAKKIYRALVAWAEYDIELLECSLSPVDRHILNAGLNNDRGLFHRSYDTWRLRRCNKILEIYGVDYFKGKTILELGCGHGDIGAFFAELGALVLCVDGRVQNVTFAKLKHRKIENVRFLQFDLERDFSELGRFDLIIDFGLIYHLRSIDTHLAACFACSDEIVMETVVCDSSDPNKVVFYDEKGWAAMQGADESSIAGTGSLPSPFYIERIAAENGFEINRHFTADLNAGSQFCYDWPHKNDDRLGEGLSLRRFWRFTKPVDRSIRPSEALASAVKASQPANPAIAR